MIRVESLALPLGIPLRKAFAGLIYQPGGECRNMKRCSRRRVHCGPGVCTAATGFA